GWTGVAASKFATSGDPLAATAPLFRDTEPRVPGNPAASLARAHFGYLAWDLIHRIDKVPPWPKSAGVLARVVGGATIMVFDNLAQTVTVAAHTQEDIELALSDLARPSPLATIGVPDRTRLPARVDVDTDDARFEAMVRRAQEYIAAGDAFQVVLARTFSVPR